MIAWRRMVNVVSSATTIGRSSLISTASATGCAREEKRDGVIRTSREGQCSSVDWQSCTPLSGHNSSMEERRKVPYRTNSKLISTDQRRLVSHGILGQHWSIHQTKTETTWRSTQYGAMTNSLLRKERVVDRDRSDRPNERLEQITNFPGPSSVEEPLA